MDIQKAATQEKAITSNVCVGLMFSHSLDLFYFRFEVQVEPPTRSGDMNSPRGNQYIQHVNRVRPVCMCGVCV